MSVWTLSAARNHCGYAGTIVKQRSAPAVENLMDKGQHVVARTQERGKPVSCRHDNVAHGVAAHRSMNTMRFDGFRFGHRSQRQEVVGGARLPREEDQTDG